MLVKDAMRSGCKSSMKRKLVKDVMRNRLQGCKVLKRGRVWEARRSTRLPSPVYMNFTYLCVWMASGQTELGLMDCIYRESDVELYVEWKGIG